MEKSQPVKKLSTQQLPASEDSGIFGLDFTAEQSKLILLPCSWDATVSYGSGTNLGPQAILEASRQVDLYDFEYENTYEDGIFCDEELISKTATINELAKKLVDEARANNYEENRCEAVNQLSQSINDIFYKKSTELLKANKIVGLVGGDHSSPLGLIKALNEKFNDGFSILHIDAHFDYRNAYENFTYSHASIMYNASKLKNLNNIVHLGIRDFCEEEYNYCKEINSTCYFSQQIFALKAEGKTWSQICDDIISKFANNNIYISFDIDGLMPSFCPNTGTPVPGGISYDEATYLIHQLVRNGKKIIGFDLCEVAPWDINEWNENVGARVLYQLCLASLKSNKL